MVPLFNIKERLAQYQPFRLKADLTRLSENELMILPFLRQAAEAMEVPFWIQNYGDKEPLLASTSAAEVRRYLHINYGPWDRLHGDEAIISGVGDKPLGANFYPADINREEFETAADLAPDLKSPFTMVRRDEGDNLVAIPYHKFFAEQVGFAARALQQAAETTDSNHMHRFLSLRAEALLTDDYWASDFAWMELKDNTLDILIGPMEIEDRLFGIKTAYAATLLVKDWESSQRLHRYLGMLPRFQGSLPVPDAYKREQPGLDADLYVYEVVHFAGLDRLDKPVGVAWPDDEEVQLAKGTRFLLLSNVMRAKFEGLITPLADLFIASDQRPVVQFEADFNFVLFHEIAHGLGVKHILGDGKIVREALGELHHPIEEGKADLVSLHMAIKLHEWGHMSESELLALYITSLARILYNFDGRQSVMRLNYFKEAGAYSRDPKTGTYRVHPEHMPPAVAALAERLLRFQGDGDYKGAQASLERYGQPDEELVQDIARMEAARLPLGLLLED